MLFVRFANIFSSLVLQIKVIIILILILICIGAKVIGMLGINWNFISFQILPPFLFLTRKNLPPFAISIIRTVYLLLCEIYLQCWFFYLLFSFFGFSSCFFLSFLYLNLNHYIIKLNCKPLKLSTLLFIYPSNLFIYLNTIIAYALVFLSLKSSVVSSICFLFTELISIYLVFFIIFIQFCGHSKVNISLVLNLGQ